MNTEFHLFNLAFKEIVRSVIKCSNLLNLLGINYSKHRQRGEIKLTHGKTKQIQQITMFYLRLNF